MTTHAHDIGNRRDGFALPIALLAMMIIGALVTGGFYASSQESRVSASTDLASEAFYIAEYGLEETLATWRNAQFQAVATEHAFGTTVVAAPGGGTLGDYDIHVRRIGAQLFLVRSTGRVAAGSRTAQRRVAAMVRTLEPRLPAPTALAIFGGLTAGGSSLIRGDDAGGPGCLPGDSVAGVTAFDSTLIDAGNKERISGAPPIVQDASLDTAGLSAFGALHLADLMASATRVYEPGETESGMAPVVATDSLLGTSVCDTSVRSNWGDPGGVGPCADEFPIILAKGDLHLSTGEGQGILIVEGDLRASGNFHFYGVVIVLGELETAGTGNHVEGSVIVQGDGRLDSESTTLGNSLVQYSRCRVDRAFSATMRARPLASRSWLDLTAAAPGRLSVAFPDEN